MIDVKVAISGIIMCCDECVCSLNFGKGYYIEKIEFEMLEFKDKITNGKGNLNTDYFGSRIIENNRMYFYCIKKKMLLKSMDQV